ncbi:hypothetical protein EYF80_040846 [Liparis tanakae]|uniref:Uncharacterized protein n=1 Tax=Liparis tanakae TaxID=230148 RepID=A0A4Z2G5V7_9TELE|nr:hypothetical protein EYF80_040846 [Liparis tanakae]
MEEPGMSPPSGTSSALLLLGAGLVRGIEGFSGGSKTLPQLPEGRGRGKKRNISKTLLTTGGDSTGMTSATTAFPLSSSAAPPAAAPPAPPPAGVFPSFPPPFPALASFDGFIILPSLDSEPEPPERISTASSM